MQLAVWCCSWVPVVTEAGQATANTVGKQQLFGCAVHGYVGGLTVLTVAGRVIEWAPLNCTLQPCLAN